MEKQLNLFENLKPEILDTESKKRPCTGKRKLAIASRDQVEFKIESIDSLISINHDARSIWEYVSKLNLSSVYTVINSLEGHPGRSGTDPKILIALWIYAISDGVDNATVFLQILLVKQ